MVVTLVSTNHAPWATRVRGPVSTKSRKPFGPKKPFVKLRPAYSIKLVISCVVKGIKIKITAKFWDLRETGLTLELCLRFAFTEDCNYLAFSFSNMIGRYDLLAAVVVYFLTTTKATARIKNEEFRFKTNCGAALREREVRCDEGLSLETSVLQSTWGGNLTRINSLSSFPEGSGWLSFLWLNSLFRVLSWSGRLGSGRRNARGWRTRERNRTSEFHGICSTFSCARHNFACPDQLTNRLWIIVEETDVMWKPKNALD